jgi:hypothetical protein
MSTSLVDGDAGERSAKRSLRDRAWRRRSRLPRSIAFLCGAVSPWITGASTLMTQADPARVGLSALF